MSQTDFELLASAAFQNQKSASVVVADTLRRAILRGHLFPGHLMPQEEIAKQFGVSRAPVRDALRKLEAEGLIVMHAHRGAEVVRLSADDVKEVFLIPGKPGADRSRLSVPRLTEADFSKASEVLDRMDADTDTTHMAELNWAFHESLYLPSGLPRLLAMIRSLNNNALPYHHLGFVAVDIKQMSQRGHRDILEACRGRNEEEAVSRLVQHLRENGCRIVRHLQDSSLPFAADRH